jgi:malonate-semialdehyde dehydrogenase (acetylating)/methylmalonate-semialdehyde dehydrogenase
MWIGQLMIEAGFPPGVLNIAHGNGSTAQELVTHEAIKTVSFVGSELAGKEIYYQCSGSGRRIQANVSAMNSVVVLPDPPKEFSISAIVQSTFAAAGQRCTRFVCKAPSLSISLINRGIVRKSPYWSVKPGNGFPTL